MNDASELIPTRQTLLSRLKDWNDQESWKVFFDTYWKLIYNTAVKAGLTDSEAQDVVQETVISVSKSMATFEYDEGRSFKSWLLRLTRWRVLDQLRKRQRGIVHREAKGETSTGTGTVERVADPEGLAWMERFWNEAWEPNLLEVALERAKQKVDPKFFQVFDLYVCQGWPASRVSRALSINPAKVYLCKHRVNNLIKKELKHLQANPVSKKEAK
jgi:RNA polymerase sigma-70 factor (ECF subfamily)